MEYFLIGLLLSFPGAVGDWLTWQRNKKDTFLKAGSWTIKIGKTFGWSIKITCYVFVYLLSEKNIIPIVTNYILLWFISGWIATLIEQKIYERKDEIIFFAEIANDLIKEHGKDTAKILINKNIPHWWLKLMSSSWQNEYYNKMKEIFRD
jgi:hypothetical protein